jgi:hypothetical protein
MLGCEGIVAHGRLAISAAPCLAKLSIRRQEGRGFRACASLFCLLRQPRQPELGHRSAGKVVQYSYDAANQLINGVEVNSPNTNANTTLYGYDTNGDPDVRGTDQEMVEDQLAWDRDPLGGGPGGNSDVVHVSDQQAQAFEEALDSKVGPHIPTARLVVIRTTTVRWVAHGSICMGKCSRPSTATHSPGTWSRIS